MIVAGGQRYGCTNDLTAYGSVAVASVSASSERESNHEAVAAMVATATTITPGIPSSSDHSEMPTADDAVMMTL